MSNTTARCTRCILPASLPSAALDEQGVCSYCRDYQHWSDRWSDRWQDWKQDKMRFFEDQRRRAKRLNRVYDCLVPLSGGKDSIYALYLCSKVYELKCLCVTFDNGFMSAHARANIATAVELAGADHIYYQANRDTLMHLYRRFLEKSGDFCAVCMRGIGLSTEMAVRAFDVPLVVHGGGRMEEYVFHVPELFQGGDAHYFRNVLKGEPLAARVGPLSHRFMSNHERLFNALFRLRIVKLICRLVGFPAYSIPLTVPYIDLYNHIDDISADEVYAIIRQEMGWTNPPDELEHMDCKAHTIQSLIWTLKFPDLSVDTFTRSHLVRSGQMAREEALQAEDGDLADRKAPEALDYFLGEIGMDRNAFESCMRDWTRMERFRERG